MRRSLSLILAILLSLSLVAAMVACDNTDASGESTEQTTQAPTTEEPTQTPTEEPTTEAPTTEPVTDATTEETTENAADMPVEGAINIGSTEDLIAWANTIHEDGTDYFEVTINFTADIDLAGHNWIPIDGSYLDCVTFEGNGHTIKNLTIDGTDTPVPDITNSHAYGFGFIQCGIYDLTFRNLNFENVNITAYERHVGVLVGHCPPASAAWITAENVHIDGYTVNGWMDYDNQDIAAGGHKIAFRVAGFVGGVWSNSTVEFKDCSLKNAKMTGFHNLAGFVGYDASASITADCFDNCHVENVEMTFSYCLADAYTVDMPKKYVSVFYNAADWVDNIDDFEDTNNSFKGVYFIDYTDPDTIYDPVNFRSWSYEEAYG